MNIAFDTGGFVPRQAFGQWQNAIGSLFVRLDVTTEFRDDFRMRVSRAVLGSVMWAQNSGSQQNVLRTEKHIAHDGEDLMVFLLSNKGRTAVTQGDRQAVLNPGEFALFDASRAYELAMVGDHVNTVIQVPRATLAARIGGFETHVARTMDSGRPLTKLAFDFVVDVSTIADDIPPADGRRLSDQALDLLGMALHENDHGALPRPSTHRAALLYRIKSVLQSRLAESTLSLESLAAEIGVSSRYVNTLLAEDGLRFERYLLTCRLERCWRDLAAVHLSHLHIGEIAFAWGFNSAAHFSRTFKTKFGMTPKEFREAAIRSSTPS